MKKLYILFLALLIPYLGFSQAKIQTPEPVFPLTGQTDVTPDVILDWNAVCGIDSLCYIVQLDTTPSFDAPSEKVCNVTCRHFNRLKFGHTYHWRVKAKDCTGNSEWCSIQSFSIIDKMECDKPNNGSDGEAPEVKLKWKPVEGIDKYLLTVDTSLSFNSPVSIDYEINGLNETKIINQLYFDTDYYWKVRGAHADDTSQWSQVFTFRTIDGCEPMKPDDGAVLYELDPRLTWSTVKGIKRYDYQVSEQPDMAGAAYYASYDTEGELSNLIFGETYYWRTRALHKKDTTTWSATRAFSIVDAVSLYYPENGAENVLKRPSFKWSQISGADHYLLVLDDDSQMNAFPKTISGESNSFTPDRYLRPGTQYYWKMVAIKNQDTSSWSQVYTFTTAGVSQGVDDPNEPFKLVFRPALNQLKIMFPNPGMDNVAISLIDLTGRTIARKTIYRQEEITLSTFNLISGVYIVKMETAKGTYGRRILISR